MAFNRFVEKEKDRVAFNLSLNTVGYSYLPSSVASFSGEPFDSRKRNQFYREVRSAWKTNPHGEIPRDNPVLRSH